MYTEAFMTIFNSSRRSKQLYKKIKIENWQMGKTKITHVMFAHDMVNVAESGENL